MIPLIRRAIEDGREHARVTRTRHCLKTIRRSAFPDTLELVRNPRRTAFRPVTGVCRWSGRPAATRGNEVTIVCSEGGELQVLACDTEDNRPHVYLLRCDLAEPDSLDRLERVLGDLGIPVAVPALA